MSNLCFLQNTEFVLAFNYNVDLIEQVKKLPQGYRRYDPTKRCWIVSVKKYGKVNELALDQLEKFLNDGEFKLHINVRNYLSTIYESLSTQKKEDEESFVDSLAGDSDIEVEGLGGDLRPFQKAGVSYMTAKKRVILGDEMGLGKTIQAIAAVTHNKSFPCLIICPVSLKLNWLREAKKWAVGKTVTDNPEEYADITVVPYSQVVKHEQLISKSTAWSSLVCDESHYIKNAKAQRTKSIKKIAKNIPEIYLLSGTPIVNRPAEFITQLQIINRLNELGGWKHFTERYCDAKKERFGLNINGASNLPELNERLRKLCYIRRFKKDVLKELPNKQRSIVEVEITNRKEYETSRKSVRKDLEILREKANQYSKDVLEKLGEINLENNTDEVFDFWQETFPKAKKLQTTNPKKIENIFRAKLTEREAFIENSEAVLLINKLKIKSMQGKLKAATEWITDFLDSGEKLVVFCDHIEAQEAIYTKFQKQGVAIMSHMEAEERQANVDKFQKNPKIKIIVCSLGAGGVGFTMTASRSVLFFEQGWTPAIHDQAEDRTHRIGQKNAVTAYYMLGKDTIDEDIYKLIEKKREIVSAASDGIVTSETPLIRDLIDKLASY
jgi:SNF2 family DNA or RNA helicase